MVTFVKYDKEKKALFEHTLDEKTGELIPTEYHVHFEDVIPVGSEIIRSHEYKEKIFSMKRQEQEEITARNKIHHKASKIADNDYAADYVQIGKMNLKGEFGDSYFGSNNRILHFETVATMYVKK